MESKFAANNITDEDHGSAVSDNDMVEISWEKKKNRMEMEPPQKQLEYMEQRAAVFVDNSVVQGQYQIPTIFASSRAQHVKTRTKFPHKMTDDTTTNGGSTSINNGGNGSVNHEEDDDDNNVVLLPPPTPPQPELGRAPGRTLPVAPGAIAIRGSHSPDRPKN